MSNPQPHPEEIALLQRMHPIILQDGYEEISFEEAARLYREVEAEFVARAGINQVRAFEVRRRIVEEILRSARDHEQPFEVCEKLWNELVDLGFSDILRKDLMVSCYADCCITNRQPEAGLAVIEPFIKEYTQFLDEWLLEPEYKPLFEENLVHTQRRREGLLAFQRSEAEGAEWMAREDARIEALQRDAPTPPRR